MAMICLVSAENSSGVTSAAAALAEVRPDLKAGITVGAELLGRRNLPGGYSRPGYMRDIRELQTTVDRQSNRPAPPARTVTDRRQTVVPGEAAHAG